MARQIQSALLQRLEGPARLSDTGFLALERELAQVHPRTSREFRRNALLLAGDFHERQSGQSLPKLPALRRFEAVSAPQKRGDVLLARSLANLASEADEWIARGLWRVDARAAVRALVTIAICHGDVLVGGRMDHPASSRKTHDSDGTVQAHRPMEGPDAKELMSLLKTSLSQLDAWEVENAGQRREPVVIFSPVTRLLVRAVRREFPELLRLDQAMPVDELAAEMAGWATVGTGSPGDIWARLWKMQAAWQRLELPPVLHVALGGNGRRSTPPFYHSWLRQTLGQVTCDAAADNDGDPGPYPYPDPDPDPDPVMGQAAIHPKTAPSPSGDQRVLSKLAGALRIKSGEGRHRGTAYERVQQDLAAATSPVLQMILRWAASLLASRSAKEPRPNSVARYLTALAPMIDAQGYVDIGSVAPNGEWEPCPERWTAMLQHVLAIASDTATSTLLIRFHRYAVALYPVLGEVDLVSLPAFENQMAESRAIVISSAEFELAMSMIAHNDEERERKGLVAALGFYAGLRISEVRRLRLNDLVDPVEMVLAVRAKAEASGKSEAASRDIPLAALLPSHWLEILDRQLQTMAAVESAKSPRLLGRWDAPHEDISSRLSDEIVAILRAATLDASITFHSLRHSFITWAEMAMFVRSWPELRTLQIQEFGADRFQPEKLQGWLSAWMRPDAEIAAGLRGLARLVGHQNPQVTVKFYAHFHALARATLIGFRMPKPSRALLREAAGWDEPTFTRNENSTRRALARRLPPDTPIANVAVIEMAYVLNEFPQARNAGKAVSVENVKVQRRLGTAEVPLVSCLLIRANHDIDRVARLHRLNPSDVGRVDRWLQLNHGPRLKQPHLSVERSMFSQFTLALDDLDDATTVRGATALSLFRRVRGTRMALDQDEATLVDLARILSPILPKGHLMKVELCPIQGEQVIDQDQSYLVLALEKRIVAAGLQAHVSCETPESIHWKWRPKARSRGYRDHWMVVRIGTIVDGQFRRSEGIAVALDCWMVRVVAPPENLNG